MSVEKKETKHLSYYCGIFKIVRSTSLKIIKKFSKINKENL